MNKDKYGLSPVYGFNYVEMGKTMFKKTLLFFTALCAFSANANVIITGTRVIYPAGQKNVIVKLENNDDSAALVQAWIDNGNPNADPKYTKTPFVITPPVARVEAKSGQSLRITFTGSEPLPDDRESLFYFNLLDIPPKPDAAFLAKHGSFMQIAIRSRLKLFYRPAKLSMDSFDAMKKVVFKATPEGVLVDNQTPYYMNYIGLLHQNKPAKNVKMVAPFSQAVFEAKGVRSGDKLKWVLVNDYGADQEGEAIAQ